jgi:pimeloyl-ACP methyl ester carboxylesterase
VTTASDWAHDDSGVGDVVVLVHGLGTDSAAWDRVAPDLAKDHRVVTVDLPGYSLRSAVDDVPSATAVADGLDALLASLGVESAVFVGHSFGGTVSLITARRHPARCAGLALIAPGGFGTELNPFIPLIPTRIGTRLMRSLYGPRTSRTIERIAGRVEARSGRPKSKVRIAELMETYDRLRSERAREQFRSSVQKSLALQSRVDRTEFSQIDQQIPILVIWGREDRVLPSWHAKNATELMPWSTVHILDGVGHTPHRSHPSLSNREIRAFADSGRVRRRLSPAGS